MNMATGHCRLKQLLLQTLICVPVLLFPMAHGAADTALFDPTQPLAPKASAPRKNLTLESTFVSSGRRLAIINGQLLAPGDSIQGAKVIEIAPYEVKLRKHGRIVRLRLVPRVTTETRAQQQGLDR